MGRPSSAQLQPRTFGIDVGTSAQYNVHTSQCMKGSSHGRNNIFIVQYAVIRDAQIAISHKSICLATDMAEQRGAVTVNDYLYVVLTNTHILIRVNVFSRGFLRVAVTTSRGQKAEIHAKKEYVWYTARVFVVLRRPKRNAVQHNATAQ